MLMLGSPFRLLFAPVKCFVLRSTAQTITKWQKIFRMLGVGASSADACMYSKEPLGGPNLHFHHTIIFLSTFFTLRENPCLCRTETSSRFCWEEMSSCTHASLSRFISVLSSPYSMAQLKPHLYFQCCGHVLAHLYISCKDSSFLSGALCRFLPKICEEILSARTWRPRRLTRP